MVLVDTSVWVEHFRRVEPHLSTLLATGQVMVHPFVLGELALGSLQQSSAQFQALCLLPAAPVAQDAEVRAFIEQHGLSGKGIGYADAHLIASVYLKPGSSLMTLDKRLLQVARSLGRAAVAPLH